MTRNQPPESGLGPGDSGGTATATFGGQKSWAASGAKLSNSR